MKESDFKPGNKIGFFNIYDKNEYEIIMGEDDRHLNFRVSLFKETKVDDNKFTITTVVKFNNNFGRLYFIPVKPFHKLIVKSMMKRAVQKFK